MMYDIKSWMEVAAAAAMLLGLLGVIIHRLMKNYGLNPRSIQFVAVIEILPIILILSLEKVISGEATSTLLGALIGYLLSGIGTYQPEKTEKSKETEKNKETKKNKEINKK